MEQEKKSWTPRGWVGAATGGIRFKPDREAVQAELLAHIEDKRADLRRLYPEMNERELDALATRQMGDPGQVPGWGTCGGPVRCCWGSYWR